MNAPAFRESGESREATPGTVLAAVRDAMRSAASANALAGEPAEAQGYGVPLIPDVIREIAGRLDGRRSAPRERETPDRARVRFPAMPSVRSWWVTAGIAATILAVVAGFGVAALEKIETALGPTAEYARMSRCGSDGGCLLDGSGDEGPAPASVETSSSRPSANPASPALPALPAVPGSPETAAPAQPGPVGPPPVAAEPRVDALPPPPSRVAADAADRVGQVVARWQALARGVGDRLRAPLAPSRPAPAVAPAPQPAPIRSAPTTQPRPAPSADVLYAVTRAIDDQRWADALTAIDRADWRASPRLCRYRIIILHELGTQLATTDPARAATLRRAARALAEEMSRTSPAPAFDRLLDTLGSDGRPSPITFRPNGDTITPTTLARHSELKVDRVQ